MAEAKIDPHPPSAPADIRWCCKCAAQMITREVGGKLRRACPECGHIHFLEAKVGVGICVIEKGAVLLVQRRFTPEKGKWSIPAGYLDYGEEPKAHAILEVKQETGLDVSIDGLIDVFHNPPEQGGATVLVLYRGKVTGGELKAGDDAAQAAFFAHDELPDLAFASTHHAIQLLSQQV